MEVIRFTADWCIPCRAFNPEWEKFASESSILARVVDIEDPEGMAEARTLKVRSIPTVILVNEANKHFLTGRTAAALHAEIAEILGG